MTETKILGSVILDGEQHAVVDWDLSNDGMLYLKLADGRELFERAQGLDFSTKARRRKAGSFHDKADAKAC
jgi:hypothetical protein